MVIAVSILMYAALTLFFAINMATHPEISQVLIGIPVFVGIFCLAFGIITVRMTHKVSGPALGLERSIHRLQEGRLEEVIRVREGDYLKNLAGALEDLRNDMIWQRSEVESLLEQLQKIRELAPDSAVPVATEAIEQTQAILNRKASA